MLLERTHFSLNLVPAAGQELKPRKLASLSSSSEAVGQHLSEDSGLACGNLQSTKEMERWQEFEIGILE